MSTWKRRLLMPIVGSMLLGSLYLAATGLHGALEGLALQLAGRRAPGTVQTSTTLPKGAGCRVAAAYRWDGRSWTTTSWLRSCDGYEPGTTVQVEVLPADPATSRVAGGRTDAMPLWGSCCHVIGVVVFGFAVSAWVRAEWATGPAS